MLLLINHDVFLSMKIVFIVATSVDHDFMASLFTFSHLAQILLVHDDLIELRETPPRERKIEKNEMR